MTKIIYFVTPKNMVKIGSKIGTKAAEFVPILGPTLEFTKKAKKVTEMTDPVSASSRGVGIIFNYCFGKAGATSIECILWLGFLVAGGVTCNPGLIAVGAQFENMVIDEILE
jgi:hypothetical protein